MTLKSIVKEICETRSDKRALYIMEFLRKNNIFFNVHEFHSGINIEVVKKGKFSDKEIIFFSHHDIFHNITEGANDNTSSVAIMLGIIQYFYFIEPHYTIKIVFNDKEEILGGLLFKNISPENIGLIIENSGSFQYLKNIKNRTYVLGVFVLELSGIGDSIYISTKSGNIKCDYYLNDFLSRIAINNNYKFIKIPVSLTDMVSVNVLGFRGTVLGSIPFIDGKNYQERVKDENASYDLYPYIWRKNHTERDNFFSIQERSLDLIFNFIVEIINNLESLK